MAAHIEEVEVVNTLEGGDILQAELDVGSERRGSMTTKNPGR